MVGAVGIGWEVAPRSVEWRTDGPTVSAYIIDVHLIGWVGRDSAAAHDIQLAVEV